MDPATMMLVAGGLQMAQGVLGAGGAISDANAQAADIRRQREQETVAAGRERFDRDRERRRSLSVARAAAATSGVNPLSQIAGIEFSTGLAQGRIAEDLATTHRTLKARGANVKARGRREAFNSVLGGIGGGLSSFAKARRV